MNKSYFKYIASVLLFGSNGIVASYILLSSTEIVFTRTLIGSLFLILIFVFSKQKAQFWKNKTHLCYLIISGIAMGASWMFLYEAYSRIGVSIATLAYACILLWASDCYDSISNSLQGKDDLGEINRIYRRFDWNAFCEYPCVITGWHCLGFGLRDYVSNYVCLNGDFQQKGHMRNRS